MKKIILFLLLPYPIIPLFLLLAGGCGSGPSSGKKTGNTTIYGKLNNARQETIFLVDVNQKDFRTLDSAVIDNNGSFMLKAGIRETGVYNLKITDANFATIIVSPGDSASISGDAKNLSGTYTISGSEEGSLFYEINDFSKRSGYIKAAIQANMDSIQNFFQFLISKRSDKNYVDSLNRQIEPVFDSLQKQMMKSLKEGEAFAKKFIDEHPKAFACIIALNLINPETDFSYYQKVDAVLASAYPNSSNLAPFHSWVAQHKDEYTKLASGSPAPDFTVKDFAGNTISLSSFRGKIVLVDFWASWCAPCRKENPYVVSAYARYKDKGLEIFSISLDEDKQKWMDAVKTDHLSWKHGSELKGWQSSFVRLYGITGIPFNVLVDKEGKILAKNLRGPQLEKALEEAFYKK